MTLSAAAFPTLSVTGTSITPPPRFDVTLGPATIERPRFNVSIGPATLEPVESKSSVPVLLMGVSLLAAVAVFSGTLRLGKRGGLSGLKKIKRTTGRRVYDVEWDGDAAAYCIFDQDGFCSETYSDKREAKDRAEDLNRRVQASYFSYTAEDHKGRGLSGLKKPRREKVWDPSRQKYVPLSPYERTVGQPTHRITPRGDMTWLGPAPTNAEAEAYEIRRARILRGE